MKEAKGGENNSKNDCRQGRLRNKNNDCHSEGEERKEFERWMV